MVQPFFAVAPTSLIANLAMNGTTDPAAKSLPKLKRVPRLAPSLCFLSQAMHLMHSLTTTTTLHIAVGVVEDDRV